MTYTNTFNVHETLASIQSCIGREVPFDVTLRNKTERSNVKFEISDDEARKLIRQLHIELYVQSDRGDYWIDYAPTSR
ncbi:MAG TPA: hypothetical protein VGD40_08660 [Chryseosolibacter sp.]